MNTFLSRIRMVSLALIAMVAFAACDSSTSALEDETQADEIELFATALATDLGLSADQSAGIQNVSARHGGGDMQAPGFLWQMALELSKTLTAEQIDEMITKSESARERLGDGYGGPRAGGPGGRRAGPGGHGGLGDLLTDEQKAAIELIRAEFEPQIRELVEQLRAAATDQDKEAFREALEVLHDAIRARVEALLTPEQLEQIEARREEAEAAREAARAEEREVMITVLGDADGATMDDILTELHTLLDGYKAQVEDGSLTREAAGELIQEAHDAAKLRMENELTADGLVIVQIHQALQIRAKHHRQQHGQGGPGQGGRPGGPGGQGGRPGGPGGQGGPGGSGSNG